MGTCQASVAATVKDQPKSGSWINRNVKDQVTLGTFEHHPKHDNHECPRQELIRTQPFRPRSAGF
jgi:hypothetical protein